MRIVIFLFLITINAYSGKYFVSYITEDSIGTQRVNSVVANFTIDSTLFERLRKTLSDGNNKCRTILSVIPLDRDTIYIHDTIKSKQK